MASETTQPGTTKSTSQLKAKLQEQLEKAKQRLDGAKKEIASLREADKESIRKMAADVHQRIDNQQAQAQKVRDEADSWIKDKKQHTDEVIASWRQKRQINHLERRAEKAEEYAVNAVVVAMLDADDAEIAVLDALDARLDADAAAASPPS
jgi:chromosome segregation ATPase